MLSGKPVSILFHWGKYALTTSSSPFLPESQSIARTILPAVSPTLVHAGTVKLGLAQPDIDIIMETTEPLREGLATTCIRLIGCQPVDERICH